LSHASKAGHRIDYRSRHERSNFSILLDHVENLGRFAELEVVLRPGESAEHGHREAHDLLRALHIPENALVAEAYIDLLETAV